MGTLKVIAKTNLTYLKEILEGNEEGLEFLEALEKEYDKKNHRLKSHNKELEDQVEELQNDLVMKADVSMCDICDAQIDFGIGTLHFKQPDNLKIQQIMERMTEEHQVNSNHPSLDF